MLPRAAREALVDAFQTLVDALPFIAFCTALAVIHLQLRSGIKSRLTLPIRLGNFIARFAVGTGFAHRTIRSDM
jgi:hypothetical protein